jgi:FdhD protein
MERTEIPVWKWSGAQRRNALEALTAEEGLEIRINAERLAITMRTPGDDFALAAGLLFAEDIVQSRNDILAMGYGTEPNDPDWSNLVQIALRPGLETNPHGQRRFTISASCGVCGKASLEEIRFEALPMPQEGICVAPETLYALPVAMRRAQEVFARTGGLHAAALFDFQGALLALKEDIGRHNAVDKVVGGEFLAGRMPLSKRILLVSGRVSFEIVQKAAMARIPILCAVSAPSSLAVALAESLKMTLIGFLRGETMNVYTGAERIAT